MYAPVNEQGQLYRPAFCDKTGKYYERHPVTGTEITGFQIPLFDQALELCRTASRRVEAHLKYIGWDVAITPDGPVLVEGNNLPVTICARTPAMWTRVCCPGSRSCWAAPLCDKAVYRAPRGETEIRRTDHASYAQKRQGT